MTDQKIDPEPPTLAARLSDEWFNALTSRVMQEINDANMNVKPLAEVPTLLAFGPIKRALREVAALTPEPVTPIGGGSQGHELNRCGGCGGRGSEPLRDGLCQTCWRKYPALREPDIPSVRESDFMRAPEPVTPPVAVPTGSFVDVAARVRQQIENEPDDDPRGLAVDMIDVDRLRELARRDHAHAAPSYVWLYSFANRLATQITETLSLRQSLRTAEQERDALRTALVSAASYLRVIEMNTDGQERDKSDLLHELNDALGEAR